MDHDAGLHMQVRLYSRCVCGAVLMAYQSCCLSCIVGSGCESPISSTDGQLTILLDANELRPPHLQLSITELPVPVFQLLHLTTW